MPWSVYTDKVNIVEYEDYVEIEITTVEGTLTICVTPEVAKDLADLLGAYIDR